MKNDEYFTPSIEDIRVGYECEIWWNENMLPENNWIPIKAWKYGTGTEDFDMIDFTSRIQKNEIRVPYLTKEQIEAEGWEIYEKDSIKRHETGLLWGSIEFTKNNYLLRWNFADMSISIILVDPSKVEGLLFNTLPEHFKCTCSCKDINTFRIICKLLEI